MAGWQKFRQILGGRSRRSHVAIYTMTSREPYAYLPFTIVKPSQSLCQPLFAFFYHFLPLFHTILNKFCKIFCYQHARK